MHWRELYLLLFLSMVTTVTPQIISAKQGIKRKLVKPPKALKSLSSVKTCTAWKNCKECITANPDCAWCYQEDFPPMYYRCDSTAKLRQSNCSRLEGQPSTIHLHKDIPLSHPKDHVRNPVQLKPQRLRLRLRQNQQVQFNVSFRQAPNYPVDLYFLMDVTISMEDDKQNLASLGGHIVQDMRQITSDFRLGFGSFVDKVVMPYVDMTPEKLKNPCPDRKECVAPYGFKNHLSLSNDTHQFTDEVSNAKISANLDDAEGGFDALMQVIVCKDKIRWSDRSRKIVVFATDSNFHYAGDGKLGGIVKPNDEKCHLDSNGEYTESRSQDYPSLSQINRVIMDQKINLIFAVPQDVKPTYERLSDSIEGASTSVLANDSSNIVDLIKTQYKKIRSEVILADDAPPEISLKYYTKCLGNKMSENNRCGGLDIGDTVVFEAQLMLEKCPVNKTNMNRTFHIYPVGLNEVLEVQLEMLCDCDCASEEEPMSSRCRDVGSYQCGICNCPEGRFGRHCECSSDDFERNDGDSFEGCRAEGVGPLCSDRGDCICGVCECVPPSNNPNHRVYGTYCECDNYSCDRAENKEICGGEKRGECNCGNCTCHKGWQGPTCDCRDTIDTCRPSGGSTQELCSGHGTCVCGVCQCSQTSEGHYGGPYCEECPSCKEKCSEFRACVECKAFGQGQYSQEECKNCTFVSDVVDELQESPTDRKCVFTDENSCSFTFTYNFDSNRKPIVVVLRKRDCPQKVDAMAIGIGIALGIVLIGLAVAFVVRFCFYVQDKRAYARFMEDTKKAVWADENPIYRQAKINYQNPIYKKES